MPFDQNPDEAIPRKWVDTWQRAGVELDAIQRAELRNVDTCEAIRQIFGIGDLPPLPPPEPTSGLVELQA
jgi:hypothetical protein